MAGVPTRLAAGLILLQLLACSERQATTTHPSVLAAPGTPVIVISIDTLRSDHLPIYGYEKGRTPAIDALRRDSVLFTHAYSHVPLTLPSHTSLLTGRLPHEHGVRDNFGNRVLKGDFEQLFYLPKALAAHGYDTAAVVSTYVLRGGTGFSSGFDFFDDVVESTSLEARLQRPAEESLEVALEWFGEGRQDPFFLLLHLYDPHAPFNAPAQFANSFESGYDAEIAYADSVVGRFLERLELLDVYDRALIILLSDHGEGLSDHGEQEHSIFVYREALQVPLLVKLPGGVEGGSSRQHPVGLIDVAPTILEILGLETDPGFSGRSLFAQPIAGRQIYAESIYPRTHFGWSELFTLIDADYQYIDAPRPELYDLLRDPRQQTNLANDERPTITAFRRSLSQYDTAIDFSSFEEEDDETRARLAALGYIGTAPTEGSLADPKDGIELMQRLRDGFDAHRAKRNEEAISIIEEVLAEQPQMVDGWEILARAFTAQGRRREAIDAFVEALRLSRSNAKILLELATLYSDVGDYDLAREHAQLALSSEPAAMQVLVQTSIRAGELERAGRELAEAYASGERPLMFKKLEAELEIASENWQRALRLSRELTAELEELRTSRPLAGLYFIQGRALVQLDQPAAAERAFVREIEINPTSLAPYTHLALLYALAGDGGKVGSTLKRMVDANPNPLAYADAARTLVFVGDQRSAAGVLREGLSRWPGSDELEAVARGS